MKKGIVLYQSKYGATRTYANWLSTELLWDCQEIKLTNAKTLMDYDAIVLGGGIYASHISGLSFLKKNHARWQDKKLAVFCVGASPYDESAVNAIKERHFQDNIKGIPCYYCRGAWDESKMTFVDKAFYQLLQSPLMKKEQTALTSWIEALVNTAGTACDWTDKAYLGPLLTYIRE